MMAENSSSEHCGQLNKTKQNLLHKMHSDDEIAPPSSRSSRTIGSQKKVHLFNKRKQSGSASDTEKEEYDEANRNEVRQINHSQDPTAQDQNEHEDSADQNDDELNDDLAVDTEETSKQTVEMNVNNTSMHSVSLSPGLKSSSSSSSSASSFKDFPTQQSGVPGSTPVDSSANASAMAAAFEWCKQQMSAGIGIDRLLDSRTGLFAAAAAAAGLQSYLKPSSQTGGVSGGSVIPNSSSRITSPSLSHTLNSNGYDSATTAAMAAMMAVDPSRFYANLPSGSSQLPLSSSSSSSSVAAAAVASSLPNNSSSNSFLAHMAKHSTVNNQFTDEKHLQQAMYAQHVFTQQQQQQSHSTGFTPNAMAAIAASANGSSPFNLNIHQQQQSHHSSASSDSNQRQQQLERDHFIASLYNQSHHHPHMSASPFGHHFGRNMHQQTHFNDSISPSTPNQSSSLSTSLSTSGSSGNLSSASFTQLMHLNQQQHILDMEANGNRSSISNNSRHVQNNNQPQQQHNQRRHHQGQQPQQQSHGMNGSAESRSPSPTSSQQSGVHDAGCDEEDMEDCEDSQSIGGGANGEWTYEEQFKQLYELSDDPKRKEFLDELFAFMQKRGTPVNRIPIMAKHVLDLFELYKLVVAKGGLVEVINKKLWREITKGLNLPSSITSAAFTLRTQYMKYLYPYENDKLHLSTQSELNAAIDGNKREGRRPVYGYDHYPSPGLNNSLTANMMSASNGGLNMNINMNSSNGMNTNGSGNGGMKTPGSNLSNELLNAAASHHGLGIQPNSHHGIMQPHHFLAAAAAAGLLSAHHPAVNGHRLFDSNGQPSQPLGLSSASSSVNSQLAPASSIMNPFIKQLYGEITPPSSSSSSSSSSTSSSCHRNDQPQHHHHNHHLHSQQQQQQQQQQHHHHHHQINDSNMHHLNNASVNEKSNAENEHSLLHINSRRGSLQTTSSSSSSSSSLAIKRPFEHLDQNLNENNNCKQQKLLLNAYSNEIKETMAKKLAIDTLLNTNNNNNSSKLSSTQNENHSSQGSASPKMKIKILSKKDSDSDSDLISIDKAISISIELNGLIFQGTLYAATAAAINNNSSTPNTITNSSTPINTARMDTGNNNNSASLNCLSASSVVAASAATANSLKTDIVY